MTHPYKVTVLAAMYALLKPVGFRKRGTTFRRHVGDVVHVVHMQTSMSSSTTSVVVTINLGVFSFPLERALNGEMTEPGEVDCHFRERIGFLAAAQRDVWWTMSDEHEASAAAQAIATLLRDKALSLFDQLTSTAALQQLWISGRCPGLTTGQRDRYLRALADSPISASVT